MDASYSRTDTTATSSMPASPPLSLRTGEGPLDGQALLSELGSHACSPLWKGAPPAASSLNASPRFGFQTASPTGPMYSTQSSPGSHATSSPFVIPNLFNSNPSPFEFAVPSSPTTAHAFWSSSNRVLSPMPIRALSPALSSDTSPDSTHAHTIPKLPTLPFSK